MMSARTRLKFGTHVLLVPAMAGALFAASGANAQGSDTARAPEATSDRPAPEEVYVYGPRIRVERSRFGGVEKVSLSRPVRFDDLDLRTSPGAHELRFRVRSTAEDMCRELESTYPFPQALGTSCYRTAVETAMVKADRAIRTARGDFD